MQRLNPPGTSGVEVVAGFVHIKIWSRTGCLPSHKLSEEIFFAQMF